MFIERGEETVLYACDSCVDTVLLDRFTFHDKQLIELGWIFVEYDGQQMCFCPECRKHPKIQKFLNYCDILNVARIINNRVPEGKIYIPEAFKDYPKEYNTRPYTLFNYILHGLDFEMQPTNSLRQAWKKKPLKLYHIDPEDFEKEFTKNSIKSQFERKKEDRKRRKQ